MRHSCDPRPSEMTPARQGDDVELLLRACVFAYKSTTRKGEGWYKVFRSEGQHAHVYRCRHHARCAVPCGYPVVVMLPSPGFEVRYCKSTRQSINP